MEGAPGQVAIAGDIDQRAVRVAPPQLLSLLYWLISTLERVRFSDLLEYFNNFSLWFAISGSIVWLSNSAYGDVPQSLADAYMDYNPNAQIVLESYSRTELMKVIDIKMGAGDDTYDVFFVDQPLIASYYWKDSPRELPRAST